MNAELKIQHERTCRETNTLQGKAECCICLKTPLSTVVFIRVSSALIAYNLFE